MDSKPWFRSKTLWANAIALGLLVAKYFGIEPIEFSGEQAALILSILNFGLRLVTKQPIARNAPR